MKFALLYIFQIQMKFLTSIFALPVLIFFSDNLFKKDVKLFYFPKATTTWVYLKFDIFTLWI